MTASTTVPTSPAVSLTALSEREQTVLRLLAQGHINKEIARELKLSQNVVDKILSNSSSHYSLYPKIGVTNAKGAVAWYLQQVEDADAAKVRPENQAAPQTPWVATPDSIKPGNVRADRGDQGAGSLLGNVPWIKLGLVLIGLAALGLVMALVVPRLPARSQPNGRGEVQMVGETGHRIRVEANGQILSTGETLPTYTPTQITFRVLNNGTAAMVLRSLTIGVRGPGVTCHDKNTIRWSAPDVPFPAVTDLTLQPGETHEYRGMRALYQPGTYFLEPVWQDTNGNWGGIPPFTCVEVMVVENGR
jgi:DNA-binding CsgD family transcriptional regulator